MTGGTPVVLATTDNTLSGVAIDPSSVYFSTSTAISKVFITGD